LAEGEEEVVQPQPEEVEAEAEVAAAVLAMPAARLSHRVRASQRLEAEVEAAVAAAVAAAVLAMPAARLSHRVRASQRLEAEVEAAQPREEVEAEVELQAVALVVALAARLQWGEVAQASNLHRHRRHMRTAPTQILQSFRSRPYDQPVVHS
jgi:hypothetical protein